ncbi:MAG: aldolase [Candidatus Riflebacteria bacterium]|nr:aldolase [Candidatus Riflebacteria bacterium]
MLRKNFLREKLQAGAPVVGTWSIIPSPVVADVIAAAGMDFLIIDAEHGPIHYETALGMTMACESRGTSPVMRVGGIIEAEILRALDIGVHCLQVPNVSSLDDVDRLIRFAKYPPTGNRGFSPFTRAGGYSAAQAGELTRTANEQVLLAIHIEGREAIDRLDEILLRPEIEIVFLGLFDISKSLGIPGQVDDPHLLELVRSMTEKIIRARKYPGTIVLNRDRMRFFLEMGMKYLTYSVDCELLTRACATVRQEFLEARPRGGKP